MCDIILSTYFLCALGLGREAKTSAVLISIVAKYNNNAITNKRTTKFQSKFNFKFYDEYRQVNNESQLFCKSN